MGSWEVFAQLGLSHAPGCWFLGDGLPDSGEMERQCSVDLRVLDGKGHSTLFHVFIDIYSSLKVFSSFPHLLIGLVLLLFNVLNFNILDINTVR
jgi:hypothetical protein